jgi:hypothetical protein
VKTPPLPTVHKVLSAAIVKAMEEPLGARLTEANFGRYADGSGWNFRLVFLREVGDTPFIQPDDHLARRVDFITDCWERSPAVREAFAMGTREREGEAR